MKWTHCLYTEITLLLCGRARGGEEPKKYIQIGTAETVNSLNNKKPWICSNIFWKREGKNIIHIWATKISKSTSERM